MSDQYSMFDRKTSEDTNNAISSPVSADGLTHSGSQDGQTTGRSGQPAFPASRGARLAKAGAWETTDTYGPLFTRSSPSAALQSSLESRLRRRLGLGGSTEYSLTWRHLDTPAGRRFCLLRAKTRRTSGQGYSGWRTPKAGEEMGRYSQVNGKKYPGLFEQAQMAGWPSPNTPSGGRSVSIETMDATGRTADGRKHTASLEHAVKFAGWPSPQAHDVTERGNTEADHHHYPHDLSNAAKMVGWATPNWHDGRRPGADLKSTQGGNLSRDAHLAGWNTPRATDGENGGPNQAGGALSHDAQLAGWTSPRPTDEKMDRRSSEAKDRELQRDHRGWNLALDAYLAGWATPQALSFADSHQPGQDKLGVQVRENLSGWATPTSRDFRSESATDEYNQARWSHPRGKPLSAEAGLIQSPSTAETTSGGASRRLNPGFSLWLMLGTPAASEWFVTAPAKLAGKRHGASGCSEPQATRSSQRSRQNLSKPISK